MSRRRHELIAELASDAAPVSRPGRTVARSVAWTMVAAGIATLLIAVDGPFRSGSATQLQQSPQFLLESILGVVAICAIAVSAFRLGIPSATPPARRVILPLLLFAMWVGMYLLGLVSPALEPSMAGKREYCFIEPILYGLPGLLIGVIAVRRLWPLHGVYTGAMLGLAAGAMPALVMQFACMYVPAHIIVFHLLPGIMLGGVGMLLGAVFLRPR